MKDVITRSITGILFVAVLILSLILHPFLFLAIFAIISALSWIEYLDLYPDRTRPGLRISGAILQVSIFISGFLILSGRMGWLLMILPGFILLVILLQDQVNQIQARKPRAVILISGIIYIALPLSCLHLMAFRLESAGTYSYRWILYTFLFLWTYDTMAYVCGRLLGRHIIWPEISPKKTWEGAVGGLVFTMLLAVLMGYYAEGLTIFQWIGFGLIAVIAGTLGDFLESYLKRSAGVKDSGKILPGHGGVLDRIDSLLLSVPFLTLYLFLL